MQAVRVPADEALARLRDGNARYAADLRSLDSLLSHRRKAEMAAAQQEPFAIILGCSDSRVPAEVVFDQGLGDLFVIRVGGNVVAPSQIGSVEFAATRFGTRLVVVMGHTMCGVVLAALEPAPADTRNQASIVERVRAALGDRSESPDEAVRANVRASVAALREGSPLLRQLIQDSGLRIVGAVYCLETGRVEFLEA